MCDKVTCESAEPSAISATPATGNQGRCRLPPKWNVDVTKCQSAVSDLVPEVPHMPRQTKVDVAKCHKCHALPRGTQVDVAKCHVCHANGTSMSPSATLATQSALAPRATNGDQAKRATRASPLPQVPRLPRQTRVDVAKCHACHARQSCVCVCVCVKDGCDKAVSKR